VLVRRLEESDESKVSVIQNATDVEVRLASDIEPSLLEL